MPVRPENRDRYPADWPAIAAAIRARAGNRCEACGVRNQALGGRTRDGTFLPALPRDCSGRRPAPGEWAWCGRGFRTEHLRVIRIVLTVVHLNHQPEDCRPENLRALCQRCHNRYDRAERRRGMRARARAALATPDLFCGGSESPVRGP
jgi:5-methylcytosine-specific restriction endonuclease McrA